MSDVEAIVVTKSSGNISDRFSIPPYGCWHIKRAYNLAEFDAFTVLTLHQDYDFIVVREIAKILANQHQCQLVFDSDYYQKMSLHFKGENNGI